MAWRLEVNDPGLSKGVELSLPGIGIVVNGETHDVTNEQAALFKAATGITLGKANFHNIVATFITKNEVSKDRETEGGE